MKLAAQLAPDSAGPNGKERHDGSRYSRENQRKTHAETQEVKSQKRGTMWSRVQIAALIALLVASYLPARAEGEPVHRRRNPRFCSRMYAWVISGHWPADQRCPLCPRKRTCAASKPMSALCQKRTSRCKDTAQPR